MCKHQWINILTKKCLFFNIIKWIFFPSVEGGQRAIIFSRLGGIQEDIFSEGLHFRLPWFQYPIIYDIRSRPRKITSPTGSKDLQVFSLWFKTDHLNTRLVESCLVFKWFGFWMGSENRMIKCMVYTCYRTILSDNVTFTLGDLKARANSIYFEAVLNNANSSIF